MDMHIPVSKIKKKIAIFANAQNTDVPAKAFLNWGIHLALEGKIDDALEKFETFCKDFSRS